MPVSPRRITIEVAAASLEKSVPIQAVKRADYRNDQKRYSEKYLRNLKALFVITELTFASLERQASGLAQFSCLAFRINTGR